MNKAASITTMLLFLSFFTLAGQQDSANLVKYTPDFKFNEGLFLAFEQVRNNDPVAKSRIVTPIEYDDPDFYNRILENKKIYFFNDLGVKEEIANDASFVDDLGADSLDTVELVMALEEEFECEIPDEEAEKITTVQLAIDYINANLQ